MLEDWIICMHVWLITQLFFFSSKWLIRITPILYLSICITTRQQREKNLLVFSRGQDQQGKDMKRSMVKHCIAVLCCSKQKQVLQKGRESGEREREMLSHNNKRRARVCSLSTQRGKRKAWALGGSVARHDIVSSTAWYSFRSFEGRGNRSIDSTSRCCFRYASLWDSHTGMGCHCLALALVNLGHSSYSISLGCV